MIPGFQHFYILCFCLSACGTHQEKAGSHNKRLASVYSAVSNGQLSFSSESCSQLIDPSFHLMHRNPFVVHLAYFLPSFLKYHSSCLMASLSDDDALFHPSLPNFDLHCQLAHRYFLLSCWHCRLTFYHH